MTGKAEIEKNIFYGLSLAFVLLIIAGGYYPTIYMIWRGHRMQKDNILH
jgi:hypothetical protein